MTRHYSIPERIENETSTLLASDPMVWRAFNGVLDGDDV